MQLMYILPRHFFFGFPMKLLTIIGISFLTANHAAAEVNTPQAVKALVSGLEEADFTNITITDRLLEGIVVEAEQEDGAILIALAPVTYTVIYVEAFSESSESGFFGAAQRPITPQIETILENYQLRLDDLDELTKVPDSANYSSDSPKHKKTAGFSQNRSLTIDGNSVTIKRSETLGLLDGFTTITRESELTGSDSTDKTIYTYSMDKTTVTQSVQMNDVSGFDSDIFIDTLGFTESILEDNSFQLPNNQSLRSVLIDQIVTTTESNFSNVQSSETPMPANIRSLVNQNLQLQSE